MLASTKLSTLRLMPLGRILCRFSSSGPVLHYEKDPGPHFINPDVQTLLKSMTRMQFEKVFRKRAVLQNQTDLKFMTVKQFEEEVQNAAKRAYHMLQMPPVVQIKEDEARVLEKEEQINGHSGDKLIITDISYDTNDQKRLILIRQPDGTLECAPQDIRKRCNQIYFPREGRKIQAPHMFAGEHLQRVLDAHWYEYLLDRLAIQFDPYEREYHEIAAKAYQHINETKKFDELRSTRHFGPMAFFFAWHRMIDDLLVDNIKRDYLRHGVELILLQYKLHAIPDQTVVLEVMKQFPDRRDVVQEYCAKNLGASDVRSSIDQMIGKSKEDFEEDEAFLSVIEAFIKTHALKKVQLELAVQTFKEESARKKELSEGLQKQHGLSS